MRAKENFNVIILTEEINIIWNKVYSVNESLSYNERMQLRKGFEDGINEFFGDLRKSLTKGASMLYHGAKKRFDQSVSKAKDYYEKGKKLAGDAWKAIEKFANDVVDKIQSGFTSAVDSITSGYEKFKQSISTTIKDASESITQAYEKMKDKGEAFLESFKGVIHDTIGQGKILKQGLVDKFKAMGEKASEWIKQNKESIEKTAMEMKSTGTEAMKSIADITLKLLKSGAKTVLVTSAIAIMLASGTFNLLVKGVQKIGEGANYVKAQVDEFIEKEKEEWKNSSGGWEEGKEAVYGKTSENLRYIKKFENFKY
jgi:gas vesicle protein